MKNADTVKAARFVVMSCRNSSLIPDRFCLIVGSLAAISLAIAGGFAVAGAWMILPFAGLEVLLLAIALRCVMRRARDYERLAIEDDCIVLDVLEDSRPWHASFNRLWAQLVVEERVPQYRIALRSHGREFEVGRYLDETGRRMLARELRYRLGGRVTELGNHWGKNGS